MVLKPLPLSSFSSHFIPPVTGFNGQSAPVANSFDSSGMFRNRTDSASKRRRHEIDSVFDRSEDYPPIGPPSRATLNVTGMRELVVAATVIGGEVRTLMSDEKIDPTVKKIGELNLALLAAIESLVEGGIIPLSGGGNVAAGRGHLATARRALAPPAPPPKPVPAGLDELRAGLAKSDLESVLFEADLGPEPVANRNALASSLSAGIRKMAIAKAEEASKDSGEAIRVMEDALSCVTDMQFLGARSQKFISNRGPDPRNNTFCTMPVKLIFDDRDARINFERSVKTHLGLRAAMSLPKPLRDEQNAINKELKSLFPDRWTMVRPDVRNLTFKASIKKDDKWSEYCSLPMPPGILLPGYVARSRIGLPDPISDDQLSEEMGFETGGGDAPKVGGGTFD